MNRVKRFINNNSIFLILLIVFIFVSFVNVKPNNDIWFLLTLGRYVHNNGIPTVDPFTIHEGLDYVMQQWGAAFIFFESFNIFGKYGILLVVFTLLFLLMIVYYKICKTLCNNKNMSVVITLITFMILITFIVNRPHIFTYLILLSEIYFLEKYISTKSVKYLYVLPVFSVLLINLHSSMWYFLFVFMLPYIVNSFNLKNITIDKYNLKPLLFVMIIMFICGFINPYGIDAITFIFKSYGVDIINNNVIEMNAPSFSFDFNIYFYITVIMISALVLIIRYVKRFKLDVRHICFIFGTLYLYFNHIKCFPYFVFVYFYSISYGLRNVRLVKFNINNYVKHFFKVFYNCGLVMLFVTFFVTCIYLYKYYDFNPSLAINNDEDKIADYIVENYDLDDVRLYCTYNEGGYYEYRNIKVYIDGKAELFLKNNNGKSDILEEALDVEANKSTFDYKSFVEKYKFTHIIVKVDSEFDLYLKKNSNYEVVYVSNWFEEEGNPFRYLYALKND